MFRGPVRLLHGAAFRGVPEAGGEGEGLQQHGGGRGRTLQESPAS